jgi:hypothetical protein
MKSKLEDQRAELATARARLTNLQADKLAKHLTATLPQMLECDRLIKIANEDVKRLAGIVRRLEKR